ncbi:MAG TPA: lactate utilization protein [Exilispira sp.]|nr:lactate utilization protein [Exilispira sp.]HPB47006.1 lactate utilization protein [Exilispira sp.]HQQ18521.1 lactate utilization protein [Exilispira sp.]
MEKEFQDYLNFHLEQTTKNFKKKNFRALIFDNKESAVEFLLNEVSKNESIGYGGSRTLQQIGILDLLRKEGYNLLDRNRDGISFEERSMIERQIFSSDIFISSANAISELGHIVNIDLWGNRLCAISFGPKRVYLFIGYNKITANLNEAIYRAKNVAAPLNAIRLNKATPCTKTGICYDCTTQERICGTMSIIEWCHPKDRITLLFIKEELGF